MRAATSRLGLKVSVAAADLDPVDPHPAAAGGDGFAGDDRAVGTGAAGAIDAVRANDRVGVGGLKGRGRGKGQQGCGDQHYSTHEIPSPG